MIVGELSLDGSVRHVKGVLPMAAKARDAGITDDLCPPGRRPRSGPDPGTDRLSRLHPGPAGQPPAADLADRALSSRRRTLTPTRRRPMRPISARSRARSTSSARWRSRRAGGIISCLSGPPGAGKTLLARSVPGILPRLTLEEALEVTRIYSVADMIARRRARP